MKADTIEFNTRTVANRFMSTGSELQLTVRINKQREWTITGWETDPGLDRIRKTEAIALRAIEIFYNSQPSCMYNPKITYATLI